jgi:hypothetical protein
MIINKMTYSKIIIIFNKINNNNNNNNNKNNNNIIKLILDILMKNLEEII